MKKKRVRFTGHKSIRILLISAFLVTFALVPAQAAAGVFQESNGIVTIEAENYNNKKTNGKPRNFYTIPVNKSTPKPDPDPAHSGAGNGKYLEILPDTRVTHSDPTTPNVSFFSSGSNAPRVEYKVRIKSAGRYYVWARAYSTGTEDNGMHVGVDGKWPTSGQAMQWCSGKNSWKWSSARRLPKNHCGNTRGIYLDLSAGEHTIMIGMREDGFELDRFMLVKSNSYTPSGVGPKQSSQSGGGNDNDNDDNHDNDNDNNDNNGQDQCDRTQECKNKYGNSATDCLNSATDTSLCWCGNDYCDDQGNQPDDGNNDNNGQDQCDKTQECKERYGNSATDCLNSASDTSLCWCGNDYCDDQGNQPDDNNNGQDQCNKTQECKNKYGSRATDCLNSYSSQSVCMCGDQPCGD